MLAASSVYSRLGAPCPLRSAATSRTFTVDVVAAQKKGAGSTKNGRNSNAQRRGVKVYGGQPVRAGGIIVRQLGTVWYPGTNTDTGKDFTLFSTVDGIVVYDKKKEKPAVHVYPFDHAKAVAAVGATHTTKPKEGTQSRAERRKTQYTTRRTTPAVSVATVAVSPMP